MAAGAGHDGHAAPEVAAGDPQIARPKLLWFNLLLTVGLMVLLILGTFPLPALFIVASAIALMVNYPSLQAQKEADRRACSQRRAGRLADLRRRYLRRHPVGHQDGRRNRQQRYWRGASTGWAPRWPW
ncbi:hypothetical protein ACU4HD_10195 [Cupriavidus basilensis]